MVQICPQCGGPIHLTNHSLMCSACEYNEEYTDSKIVCGPNDRALIDRIGNKFKHASTLEHLNYSFQLSGISRACLQEIARHRHTSLSVKSTRYTLKELKSEEPFIQGCTLTDHLDTVEWGSNGLKRASEYIVLTGNSQVDIASILALDNSREVLQSGISNDIAKFCLPESYKTSLAWTINARSLQNFLSLRTHKSALWEIRDLANAVYDTLPEDHKYLFIDCIQGDD